MDKKFIQEQSIELISEMIQQAKKNSNVLQTGVMLLWGYAIFIGCILHFIVYQLELYRYLGYVWAGTVSVAVIITIVLIAKGYKTKTVTTYTDSIIDKAWLGYGISIIIIIFMFMENPNLYFPAILFLYTFTIYITAVAYKSKELIISTLIIVACVISYKFIPESYYPLPMAIAMLCGNIIPGHILYSFQKKNDKGA